MQQRHIGFLLRQWLPVIFWLGVIAMESTDLMSSQHTGGLIYSVVSAVFQPIDREKFEIFHFWLRKTGHFTGYGILALLFWRALRATFTGSALRWYIWSVALTCLVASLDEWHQTFLPSRTGRFHDVALDTCGGIIFLVATAAIRTDQQDFV